MTEPGPASPVFQARVEPGSRSFDAPAAQTLLLSAANAGLEMPSSCRNGTCRTCICRVLEGQVQYRIEWPGLLAEEKAQGFILPCVAYPRSDLVLQWPGS
jgi:ferredoxin